MKLTEEFINKKGNPLLSDWGHEFKLKYKYEKESDRYGSEVKTYKMSKKELEEYLKKYEK